eukprot:5606609-Amphidinium_carterae.1
MDGDASRRSYIQPLCDDRRTILTGRCRVCYYYEAYVIRDVAVAKLAQAKNEHDEYPSMPVTHSEYDHRE